MPPAKRYRYWYPADQRRDQRVRELAPQGGINDSMNPLGDLPIRLRPFVRDGRISAMPAKHSVRLLLLDLVAQAFEPGRRYPEIAVNEILKDLYDDYVT